MTGSANSSIWDFVCANRMMTKNSPVSQVHLFGASLGGFLAQKFAECTHKSPRVHSLILCNSFSDTSIFNQTWTANRWCLMIYHTFHLHFHTHHCVSSSPCSSASGWCQLSCWRRLFWGTLRKDLWTPRWQMQLTSWLTGWVDISVTTAWWQHLPCIWVPCYYSISCEQSRKWTSWALISYQAHGGAGWRPKLISSGATPHAVTWK